MGRGGKRAGAGRKKGRTTLEKEAAREVVRALVFAQLEPLVTAQITNAQGLKYLVVRDKKTGKFLRVGEARAAMQGESDEETIEVWEKDPQVQAFTDLMNRALDKPAEQEQAVAVSGDLVIRWK
jgi:hypothetical protein